MLVQGSVKEDAHRDVFWQKSFVKDDLGEICCNIVICASQEFMARVLNKTMKDTRIDLDMTKWFTEKTELQYSKITSPVHNKDTQAIFDIYPKTEGMLEFAYSLQ